MRHLVRLESVADVGLASEPIWGARQSVMFLGAVLVTLSVAGVLLVGATIPRPPRRDLRPELERLSQQFRDMSPRQALREWNNLARWGIGAGVTPEQQALAARRRQHRRWFYVVAASGAAGLILLGSGLAMPRRASGT